LILIPGSFGTHEVYTDVLPHLDSGFHLVFINLRGHGESHPPPKDGSIEQFAGDVIAVADNAGIGRFFVGGHSIGGMVALQVGIDAPERTLGIISGEGWTRWQAQRDAFGDAKAPTTPEEILARRIRIREKATEGWTEDQIKEFARIWRRWDCYSFLESTELPILELWGDRGREKPSLDRLYIPERENIEVGWIEGSSHSILYEAPVRVAGLINEFVWRIWGAKEAV
ncbi:MAG: alpha/beta hydrolase, partial [Theionarchaea archaeon]|nr:alpha/beta hydrolase [Theionarchaea archaeon]